MDYNILLILLLVHSLGWLFFKKNNILSCGLFGYVGSEQPSMDKIKILGIYNIERGKDSCGISIDDMITKHNGNFNTFIESNILPDPTQDFTIIGHDRKRSSGVISIENAHPFGFFNDENADEEIEIPDFIGAHNGTIYNDNTLATKYKVDTNKYSVDSQILLKVISTGNYKILEEYSGAAALLMRKTNEPNTLYVFKGASRTYANFPLEEERPLFYWQKSENEMYISSLKDSLKAIGGDQNTIHSFETNKVIKIVAGSIVDSESVTIDRVKENYNSRQHYNSRNSSSNNSSSVGSSYNRTSRAHISTRKANLDKALGYKENVRLSADFIDAISMNRVKDTVYWNSGKYRINQKPINGMLYLNKRGKVYTEDDYNELVNSKSTLVDKIFKFAFIDGQLLMSPEYYDEANSLISQIRKVSKEEDVVTDMIIKRNLSNYTLHPICLNEVVNPSFFHFSSPSSLSFRTLFNRPVTINLSQGDVIDYIVNGEIEGANGSVYYLNTEKINLKSGEKENKSSIIIEDEEEEDFQTGEMQQGCAPSRSNQKSNLKEWNQIISSSKEYHSSNKTQDTKPPKGVLIQTPSLSDGTKYSSSTICYCEKSVNGVLRYCECDKNDAELKDIPNHIKTMSYVKNVCSTNLLEEAKSILEAQIDSIESVNYKVNRDIVLVHGMLNNVLESFKVDLTKGDKDDKKLISKTELLYN